MLSYWFSIKIFFYKITIGVNESTPIITKHLSNRTIRKRPSKYIGCEGSKVFGIS
jgi:hypothetical protein